jgi:hypothetical protein
MKISELAPPPIRTMGKIRRGVSSTGSPESDDSLDGSDIEKSQKEYVAGKKAELAKVH